MWERSDGRRLSDIISRVDDDDDGRTARLNMYAVAARGDHRSSRVLWAHSVPATWAAIRSRPGPLTGLNLRTPDIKLPSPIVAFCACARRLVPSTSLASLFLCFRPPPSMPPRLIVCLPISLSARRRAKVSCAGCLPPRDPYSEPQ